MERFNNRNTVLLLFLLAFALRVWSVGEPPYVIGDEFQFIPAAENFQKNGLYAPVVWLHPPLNFHVTAIGIKLFGNNAYGWRLPNVLFGSLSVLMLLLLALRLFEDRRVAWLSGLFFAIEPFHISLSRTNFMEIIPIFFFLLFVYAIALYMQGNERALAWAGIPLGLALSGKWYFVLPTLAVFAYLLLRIWSNRDGQDRILSSTYLASSGVVAGGVYLLLMYPWFKRGSNLLDFIIWQKDAYHTLQAMALDSFVDKFFSSSPSVPWHWFVKPLIHGEPIFVNAGWGKFFTFMSNPPIWLLTIPAAVYGLYYAYQRRERSLPLVLLLFASSYLQFILVKRPVFLYSAFAVLPFAYLLIAYSLASLTMGSGRSRKVFSILFCLTAVWGLYLYPFVTGRMVPAFLYSYLLSSPSLP
ncbi:MAG: glycosyltransferase family 39 protein [Nitrospirota bacterium]|nr:glycosyltransferase family 39 protein [Nitrospirota bacterium]